LFVVVFGLPLPALGASVSAQSYADSGAVDSGAEEQILKLLNGARQQHGLAPLALDGRLTVAARKHSRRMAERAELSHQLPGEPPLQDRIAAENLAADRAGENVGLDQNAVSAHEGLMNSPPHRRDILDPEYNAVGIAVVRRGKDIYVTEDFARRLPQLSEPQAEAAAQQAIEQYVRLRRFPAPVRRPQPQLQRIACDMARKDAVSGKAAARFPGVRTVFAWSAGDPVVLPRAMDPILSSGLPGGYSLAACFAPSVSHPGGFYWLVMVSYW
jgi:hypothetical protein